jgi:hypothetical protein
MYTHAAGGIRTQSQQTNGHTPRLDCTATGIATLAVTGWIFDRCAGVSCSVYTFLSETSAHTFTISWTWQCRCGIRVFCIDVHPCGFSYPETLLCILQQTTLGPSNMARHVTSSCSRCLCSSFRLEVDAVQCSRMWVNFSSVVGITCQETVLSHVTLCLAVFLA